VLGKVKFPHKLPWFLAEEEFLRGLIRYLNIVRKVPVGTAEVFGSNNCARYRGHSPARVAHEDTIRTIYVLVLQLVVFAQFLPHSSSGFSENVSLCGRVDGDGKVEVAEYGTAFLLKRRCSILRGGLGRL
jgi:hypothetical protein